MRDVSDYLIENKNIAWAVSLAAVAVVIAIFVLNAILGLFVHFFDYTQNVFWHLLSPYLIALLFFIIFGSIVYELLTVRQGGQAIARRMKARQINPSSTTPEESIALEISNKLAYKFGVEPAQLYLLPDEIGVNAFTAGFKMQDIVIVLTWGALQNLDKNEMIGLLSHCYQQIIAGETSEHTKIKILLSGLIIVSQIGSRIARLGFNPHEKEPSRFEAIYVAIGGVIWLLGCLGVLISRLIKYWGLSSRTFRNDKRTMRLMQNQNNLQTLLRIHAHHDGSQIHSIYSEAIAHCCFANSLSPQSWLNIHPTIQERISQLDPLALEETLKRRRFLPFYRLSKTMQQYEHQGYLHPWKSPQPLPVLRLSPISFASRDTMKPLQPDVRANMKRPELIRRAMQTSTGCREVMVAILMIRQYREFCPSDAPVSHSIVDALLKMDGRVHIQIFLEACQQIGQMPNTMSRQYLTKLAKIVQEDGEIGLLDALLVERVRAELGLMPPNLPTAFEDVKYQVVRLIDALIHVQQINTEGQMQCRKRILEKILDELEYEVFSTVTEEPLDLYFILSQISGLLLHQRLSILGLIERNVWSERVITQDELDVLELLYWRLGFDSTEIVDHMLKRNSLAIL